MPKTYKEIMGEARKLVPELSPAEVKQKLDRGEKPILLDVREKEEYRDGHLAGALSLPRGFLEIRVEEAIPDRSTPIVAYCAGGTRSLLAARMLREMGYENVISMSGGFTGWKNPGLPFTDDRQWTQEQADTLQPSLPASRGRREGAGQASRREGAPHRRRRPRLADGVLPGGGRRRHDRSRRSWTSSISRTCSARSCTPTSASACRRSTPRS